MIGVANDNLWRKFCAVTGLSAIVDDIKFRTNADRVAHRKETLGHVQAALRQNSVAHWNEVLTGVGVPCAPINSIAQLLDHPHTKASGIIVDYEHQTGGPAEGRRSPRPDQRGGTSRRPAAAGAGAAHRRCAGRNRFVIGNHQRVAAGNA